MVAVRTSMVVACSSIDCCSCPEPSCLSIKRLSFIEAWVITALWPKCCCCLVFSYVPCVVWTGCCCRTTIVMTIFLFLVCWNSVLTHWIFASISRFVTIQRTDFWMSGMERQLLRPKELSVEPEAPDAARVFAFWLRTVED